MNQFNLNTFQGFILTLQDYWAQKGCAIVQPLDMEVGAGTFHPQTFLRAIAYRTNECGLCPAMQTTNGWPLWRQPKPSTTLLSISSGFKTIAKRNSSLIFRLLRSTGH